jgi:Type II CAAX prenyl endopeptidase Rce1-like
VVHPDDLHPVLAKPWYAFVPYFFEMVAGGGLEEFGWRGIAQPELERRFRLPAAAWIVGCLWAVWHLPLFAARRKASRCHFVGQAFSLPTGFHPVHQPKAGFGVRRQSLPARSRHVHELAHCWPGISGLFAWLSSRASASEICFSWLISVSSWTSCWVRSGARIRPRLPEPQPFSRLPCQLLLCRSPNRPRSCLFSCLPYRPLVRRNSRRSAYEGSTFAALVVGFRDRLRYPESLPRRYWGDARGSGAEGVAAAVIPKWCQPPGRATGCCRDARP